MNSNKNKISKEEQKILYDHHVLQIQQSQENNKIYTFGYGQICKKLFGDNKSRRSSIKNWVHKIQKYFTFYINQNLNFENFYSIYNQKRGRKIEYDSDNIMQEIQCDLSKRWDSIILGLKKIILDVQNPDLPRIHKKIIKNLDSFIEEQIALSSTQNICSRKKNRQKLKKQYKEQIQKQIDQSLQKCLIVTEPTEIMNSKHNHDQVLSNFDSIDNTCNPNLNYPDYMMNFEDEDKFQLQ